MILDKLFTNEFILSNRQIRNLISLIIILLLLLSATINSFAEGTKELMPTSSDHGFIQINDRGRKFATYNASILNRLYVHICSPGEIIYFGFKQPDNDIKFRLKDPAGNIVVAAQALPTSGTGYIANYNKAVAGPQQLIGTSGYDAMSYTSLVAGDYYIEFNNSGSTQRIFDFFDITVASGSTAKMGRVWSYSWDINTKATTNAFTGKMYILSTDSIVTSIDFNGMQPFGAVIAANSTGLANTGDLVADRKSKVGDFSVPEYKIFLNDPDNDCYPTGSFGNIVGQPIVTGCDPANRCINITVNKPGKVEIVLDLNPTTGYQLNTEDHLIIADVLPGKNCIPWDSKDGLGNLVPSSTGIPLEVSYLNGVTHLPLYDVEANPDGYIVELIRPAGAKPNLYWDDSAINKGTAIDGKVNLAGCSNASGCHRWKDRGDNASSETINTWWYPNIITKNLIFDLPVATVDADTRNAVGILNDSLVCEYITSFKLNGVVDPTMLDGIWTGGTGTFSPSRNVVNPTYVPSQTEKNTGFVKLYLSSTPNGICPPAKDSVNIQFEKAPRVKLTADQILCSTVQSIPTIAILTNATTGMWTGGNGTFTAASNKSTTYNVVPSDITVGNINLVFTSTGTRLCAQEDDTINIIFEKPPIVQLATDKTICLTNNTLPVSATLTNATTGIWTGGTGTFTDATNKSTNYTVSLTDQAAGNVNLIFKSTGIRACPQEDDTINITFNTPVAIEVGAPITICAGVTTVDINATGNNTATLTWSGGNGSFLPNNALTTTYTLAPTESAAAQIDLTLTASKGVCPDSSDVLHIKINPLPTVFAGKDTLICKGTDFTFNGTSTTNTNRWYTIPSQTTQSNVTSFTLSNIHSASNYVFESIDLEGCKNTDTISIDVYELPNLNPGGPYCIETGLKLQAQASNVPNVTATFIWKRDNILLQSDPINTDIVVSSAGIYKIIYETVTCNTEATVIVHPKPILTSPDTLSACEGISIKLYTNPSIGSTYTWYDPTNTFIQTGTSINISTPNTAHTYFVHAVDINGCINKDSIVALGSPIPNFTLTNAEICADSIAQFDVNTTNIPSNLTSQLMYEWQSNSTVLSTSKLLNTQKAGTYSVKVSLNNCVSSKNVDVVVHDLPLSSLPTQYTFCSDNGAKIELNAGNAHKYHWIQTNETTQSISVGKIGTYEVLVYNSFMCKLKNVTVVKEECQPTLFVSSAFSPNGDNMNDFYETFDNHIDTYNIIIFSRWGEIVFQSNDKSQFWDGYYKGELMPVGVYPFVITYEGDTDTYKGPYKLEGSVTLIK